MIRLVKFIILVLGVFFFACKKDTKTANPPIQNIPSPGYEDLKPYCYFKTGSYWVYQDSLHPTNFDSIYVIQHGINWDTIKTETFNCIKPGIYELFGTKMKDSQGKTWDFICESSSGFRCVNQGRVVVNLNVETSICSFSFKIESVFLSNWFNPGYVINSMNFLNEGDKITFLANWDSVKVYNATFKNVIKFNSYISGSVNTNCGAMVIKSNTDYLISKNIGIIKRVELDSNRVWNLIRYKIIP